jgi:hypothetical protein
MNENEHYLFVLARPSGSKAAESSTLTAMSRRVVESAWAVKHGVDLEQIRELTSGTETNSHSSTPCATTSGTGTNDGAGDITTDHTTDSSDDPAPDITNDNC